MNEHGRLHIEIFNDPFYQENGLLLWCAGDDEAWIVDPGLPPQAELFVECIRERGLKPSAIVLTHCHPDHIAGVVVSAACRGRSRQYPQVPRG